MTASSPPPDGGPSAPSGVLARLFDAGYQFDFFQALWLLEQWLGAGADGDAFEVTPRRARGRIQLHPRASSVFPAADVHRIAQHPASASPNGQPNTGPTVDVTLTFMGLYGVNAPLPPYFTEPIFRTPEDSEALRGFLDLLNHRIYTLFYRSWKKYRPLRAFEQARHLNNRSEPLHLRAYRSLAGLGVHTLPPVRSGDTTLPPGPDDATPSEDDTAEAESASRTAPRHADASLAHPAHLHWAAFAGRLSGHVRNREGLEALLGQVLDVPVRVVENVGRWTTLRQRPGIGGSAGRRLQLGRGGVVGGRVFDVAGKFRVVLGPLDLTTYQALRPDGPKARLLRAAVALYLHDALDYDVELRLDPSEMTPATLSDRRSRVGSTARLGRPPDTVVSEVVAYDGSRSLDA
jgi:type VI secretion system protein ImpH